MSNHSELSTEPALAKPGWLALLTVFILFAAVAPTLTWLEFSSGSENLVTATVLEMHASGPWLVPNLNGQPRIRKPPVPAWVAASLVPADLVRQLDAQDTIARHAAYRRLAWTLRWPPLVLACLIALATFEIGRTMVDTRHGLVACAVCASSLLLLRYGRSATTDVHLALWVTVTNLCLIKSWYAGRLCLWLPLAGAAAGLAFMSKGPVGLTQSVMPFTIFAIVRGVLVNQSDDGGAGTSVGVSGGSSRAGVMLAIILSVAVFVLVAAPWFIVALNTVPNAWELWRTEITRDGATTLRTDSPLTYFVVFPMVLPWTVFLVAGLIECARRWKRSPAMHASLLLLMVPLIVMSLVKDKNERYLLPLVSAAALVSAFAIMPQLRLQTDLSPMDRLVRRLHMTVLWLIAVGLPVVGAVASLQPGGQAWWGWGTAGVAAGVLAVFPVSLSAFYARRQWLLVALTAGLMLAAHALFLHGYRTSMSGRSEMRALADDIRASMPAADVFYVDRRVSPKAIPQDLQIYLNRPVVTIYGPATAVPEPLPGRVLVMLQREGDDAPGLKGWRLLAKQPWGLRAWHALVAE